MRNIILYCIIGILLVGCDKNDNARVEIYMLSSYNVTTVASTNPAILSITNAVLENKPLVKDADIEYYSPSTTTFKLRKDLKPIIGGYGPDKAFALTVNKQVIYYGKMHPSYLSSITIGMPTIDPILTLNNELRIQFANIIGLTALADYDKRNDDRLIRALRESGRIR